MSTLYAARTRTLRRFATKGEILKGVVDWAGVNATAITSSTWVSMDSISSASNAATSGTKATADITVGLGTSKINNVVEFTDGAKGIRSYEVVGRSDR